MAIVVMTKVTEQHIMIFRLCCDMDFQKPLSTAESSSGVCLEMVVMAIGAGSGFAQGMPLPVVCTAMTLLTLLAASDVGVVSL